MVDIKQFYPNMLKIYCECPAKFRLKYIDKTEIPTLASFFEKGKKIHALANYYLKNQDISKLQKALNNEEKEIFEKLINNPFFKKEFVNSEYNLSAKIENFWLSGRMDAIMKDKDSYYILDYKTGYVPKNPEYDFQTIFYLLILDEFLKNNIQNEQINFVYIDLKNNKNIQINLTEDFKKQYKNLVAKTCTQIQQDITFEPNKSDKCKYCEYSKICRY